MPKFKDLTISIRSELYNIIKDELNEIINNDNLSKNEISEKLYSYFKEKENIVGKTILPYMRGGPKEKLKRETIITLEPIIQRMVDYYIKMIVKKLYTDLK